MTNIQQIEANKGIRTDMGTQTREAVDDDVVLEYAAAMEAGAKFPPIVVFYIEAQGEYVLVDGYHRLLAHRRVWPERAIDAEVLEGNLYDAQWYSYSANKTHGVRRNNPDKVRAVKAALLHPHGAEMSDRQIAEHVGVSNDMVSRHRKSMEHEGSLSENDSRTGRDGRTINTSNIGNQPEPVQYEPQRVCNECKFYDDVATYCSVKGELQQPGEDVCDRYKQRPVQRFANPPIPVNQRKEGRAEVYLPWDDPQEAAAELRMMFELDYIEAVVAAWRAMEADCCAA